MTTHINDKGTKRIDVVGAIALVWMLLISSGLQAAASGDAPTQTIDEDYFHYDIYDVYDAESMMPVEEKQGTPRVQSSRGGVSDPALRRLNDELTALIAGRAPESMEIDALFTVPLDEPDAVKQRLQRLPEEVVQLKQRIRQIETRLADPESLAPLVTRPDILTSKPLEPKRPIAPVTPTKPTRLEIRAYQRRRPVDPAADPRVLYENAVATYEQERAKYDADVAVYETEHAVFLIDSENYRNAEAVYSAAVEERQSVIAAGRFALESERDNLKYRIVIAELRREYLSSLSVVIGRLTEPGLEMFRVLKSPRTALRKRAEAISNLTSHTKALLERVQVLHRRAGAGSLVGFQVQQGDIFKNLSEEVRSFEQRLEKGEMLAKELMGLAAEIESDSRARRLHILVSAGAPNLKEIMDRTFQERLRDSRRASRVSTGFAITESDLAELEGLIDGLLLDPEAVATVTDGSAALLDIRAAGERLDQTLDAVLLGLDRYRQAYKRELVTIYAGLASPEVKTRAYSFSYSFFEDFLADMNLLRVDLALWLEDRRNAVSKVLDSVRRREGQLRIVRIVGGVVLILMLIAGRGRLRRRMTRVILRLVNLSVFKRRAGLLVRLTVFILALLPIASVAISGYALLYLIGMEYPETRIAEIAFRWGLFYLVGRQIVVGLTRTERSGRPPLIEISRENFNLLRLTYGRLGLFLVIVAAADEWSRDWMGTGSLNTMVRFVATAWMGIWLLWAVVAWRRSMADSCLRQVAADSVLRNVAQFSRRSILGVVATPLLFLWLVGVALYRMLRKLMAEGNLLAYLRARTLRRLSKKNKTEDSIPPMLGLPTAYTDQFPLYPLHGEEGEVLLPRRAQMDVALKQIARWRDTKQDGSLVLVGEKGIGKTTFLALLEREMTGIRTTRHIFAKKLRSEQALLKDMCRPLGLTFDTIDDLARYLNEQPPQVILLDEAHNIFLRTVNGFQAVNALVSLVDSTSDNVFWVMVFNGYSWAFLKKVNQHVQAFRKVLRLPPWSQNELKELVAKRNDRSGCEVVFDEVLLDAESGSGEGFELISSADGFFRLLWEVSRGNPRVATYLWLNALTAVSLSRIHVGLIREEDSDFLGDLGAGMRFALAATAQHENLSFEELGRALNISLDEAVHAARFLLEYGLLEPKHTDARRYTLSPRFHQQVIRTLRSHHLLYWEE